MTQSEERDGSRADSTNEVPLSFLPISQLPVKAGEDRNPPGRMQKHAVAGHCLRGDGQREGQSPVKW
jgi:hypothetical protein